MEVVTSPDIMAVSLDPEGAFGPPEIVWITDHAAASSSATIERHKENTLAREHPIDTDWVNALTAVDVDDLFSAVEGVEAALANYLLLSGGTLTGFLTLYGNPTAALHAVTKQYVDTGLGGKAATVHTHSYASTSHNHDGDYAPTHSHPYSGSGHNHDADYAGKTALLAHSGTNSQVIVSSSGPSGGQNGDIWLKI